MSVKECAWDAVSTIMPLDEGHIRAMGQRQEISFADAGWLNQAYCSRESHDSLFPR